MKCEHCQFYWVGWCRRFPPQVIVEPGPFGGTVKTEWPQVKKLDRCGEFKDATQKP